MATKTISKTRRHELKSLNALDLVAGESKALYDPVKLNDVADTLAYLGAMYADEMAKALKEADASSSGKLADSIIPLEVEVMGSLYIMKISALSYAEFISGGVDGWGAASKGGKYKYKRETGTPPKMIASIKEWLSREASFSKSLGKYAETKREKRAASITDASTRAAKRAAFMIKRQGIAPTHFLEKAETRMRKYVKEELAAAIRIDIINSFA